MKSNNYLLRKLLQQQQPTDVEYYTVIETYTEIVDEPSTTTTTLANNITTRLTTVSQHLSTLSTMSNFDKNKELINEAAKKLKST